MTETATETATGGTDDDAHGLPIGTDGETLPAQEIVTGRGFITGKSGAGKSNSVTVLLEELLDLGLPALVVDTDAEYHPLKERYDVLHVGGDDDCDTIVDESDADRLADLALGDGVPIVLDVSAFASDDAAAVIDATVQALFTRAKRERRPYLLVVEEIHEYLPQRGGDDLAELLTSVAKRGRKYGLGILGASQRPSSVDKDFITQANWMVWHRLTYDTDTKTAGKNLGKEYRDPVSSLDDGEAFVQADFFEGVNTLQFRKKHVHDAGATPEIDPYVDTPTVHDTAALLERFATDDGASGAEGDETPHDDAGDDPASGGGDSTADRLSGRDNGLGRDTQRGEYHRRAAERLAATVVELRADLEEAHAASKPFVALPTPGAEIVAEIVDEEFGIRAGKIYDRYCERVGDPRACRTVRGYLSDLTDAGEIIAAGEHNHRRYYPVPDAELPGQITPAEAVVAVRDAETVSELQRELRVERSSAEEIAGAFEHATIAKDNHTAIVGEIVGEHFGGRIGDVYDRYRDRVDDPYSKKTIQRRLGELADAGAIVSVGKNSGRRYYPVPDVEQLPDRVTPAEVVVAVRDAETVLDVQQELRIKREQAKRVVNTLGADIRPPNASMIRREQHTDTERVTVRLPARYVRAIEKGVKANKYESKTEPVRRGVRKVVEPVESEERK